MCSGITGAEVGAVEAPCCGATGKELGAFVEEDDARDPGGPLLEGTGVCGKAPIAGALLMAFRVGGFSVVSSREDVGVGFRRRVLQSKGWDALSSGQDRRVVELVRASSEAQARERHKRAS